MCSPYEIVHSMVGGIHKQFVSYEVCLMVMGRCTHRTEPGSDCENESIGLEYIII